MSDFELPENWTLEDDAPEDGFSLITTPEPHKYRATIDWKQRTFRLGITSIRNSAKLTTKKYKGRHWKTNLLEDAVAYLVGLILLP